jgi:cytidylate kinase
MADQYRCRVRVVTISAAFGAGGSVVARAVAERLDLPFLDRAIPLAVARSLSVPVGEALDRDERRPSLLDRIVTSLAAAAAPLGIAPTAAAGAGATEDAFRATTEEVLRELALGGGVVLGRAGAVVLGQHPAALHVRLDGRRDKRVHRVMSHEQMSKEEAEALLNETDRAWESYVRYFYKTDPRDSRLYHLMIDTTAVSLEATTDLIVAAASAPAPTDT